MSMQWLTQSRTQKTPPLERIEAQTFKRQQIAFCVLTLFVISALLMLHVEFATLLGRPSRMVVVLLAGGFLSKALEWYWLTRQGDGITPTVARIETAISILFIFILALVLTLLTDRDDAPYFVLLAIPILQCAYHFGLVETILTISASVGMILAWAHHFFTLHPPARPTEFLESGMISVIYTLMGLLVWYLVNQLAGKEAKLVQKMTELELARARLAIEEKLAAVGRLASGIAHEIRNPVAMIASSLSTASFPNADPGERDEMFMIAAREAKRLENLTSDFLSYAKPSSPQKDAIRTTEILDHIASVTRIRAAESSISVEYGPCVDRIISVDAFQLEGALVNISLNAVSATPSNGRIAIRSTLDEDHVLFDIENSGERIPDSELEQIFEPFFTTKHTGTGLGLAIARGVARAHGGDLWVSKNEDGAVAFTMSVATNVGVDLAAEGRQWLRC